MRMFKPALLLFFTTLQTFRSQLASQSSQISVAVAGWGAAEPGAEILLHVLGIVCRRDYAGNRSLRKYIFEE